MTDTIDARTIAPTQTPRPSKRDLTGSGYGRPTPTFNTELTEIGAGKPMGEYMRRFWQPVAISADIKDVPIKIRILAEDLIVFRDGEGKIGCLYERCAHRQASLFYGRVEDNGIRCCYHGWKFDVEGHCVDQPLETGGGKCHLIRQPWYPAEELYGLVFIYMGPPDQMPLLPRYDCMEPLLAGEHYAHGFDSLPGAVGHVLPTSWLLDQDNIHDMGHALWLHHLHSGPQFGSAFDYVNTENAAYYQNFYQYIETELGMYSRDEVALHDGSVVESFLETQMPNVRFINPPIFVGPTRLINWCVPVDDGSHYTISLARVKADGIDVSVNPMAHWDRSDPAVVQRKPSDNEAQNSSGPIAWHSEEHLAPSDRGVIRLRRQYQKELKAMADGRPLMNVRFEGDDPVFPVKAGAYVIKAAPVRDPATAAPAQAVTIDASGDWSLSMETPMGAQTSKLTLVQMGDRMSGSLTGPDGNAVPLSNGSVSGETLTFSADLTQPMAMTIVFEVKVTGDAMAGTFRAGPFPPGPATGVRA